MAKKVLIVLGLNLLIILALAGRATVAQPSQDERPAVACFVPEAELPPRPDAALPPSVVELKRDVAIPYRGITTFQANDQIGLVLQASSLQYPLWVNGLRCYLAPYPGSASSVVLQAHVYGLAGDAPGALLGSSDVLTASLGSAIDDYTLTFSAPVEIASPQAFLIALQYKSGSVGSTPAIVMDISHDIPRNVAFYRRGGEAWVEHYAKSWSDVDDRPIPASEMGYPMLRAWVETSGGPSDISIQEASAADTTIGSSQAMGITGAGARPYLELGACGDRGNTRALLRFALPTAPVAGATPIAAAVRLYHNGRLTVTVPMTVTTYRATQDWGETIPSTGWYTHSAAYAEAYGSDDIPARNPAETRQDYLLQLDVSQLVIKWYQGAYPEQGMMLIGNEDVANGCKELQSREYQGSAMRPKLVVQWALPAATPYGTPGPTVTHTPTRTLQPTPSYTPSTTPTGLPTSTRTATPTRTLTITPGGPTLTPATRGLHLPMIRKG